MNDKKLYFSTGNKKLISNDKIQFAIFSLPAEKTCPYSTALCRKSCYAKKAERLYPSVRASRENNLTIAQSDMFVMIAITQLIELVEKATRKRKLLVVRIHESGDFFSQNYVNAWLEISEFFIGNGNIVFMAYTKSIEYFDTLPNNILLRFSLWDDTPIKDWRKALELNCCTYSAYDKEAFKEVKPLNKCLCIDCGNCMKCYNDYYKSLVCELH